jgi:CysZ protein
MSFWSDLGKGATTYVNAAGFVFKHGLWVWFLYPAVLVVLLRLTGTWSIYELSAAFVAKIASKLTPDLHSGYTWLDWMIRALLGFVHWIVSYIIGIYLMAFFLKILKYIVLVFCSPMMAILSQKTDTIVTGKKYPFEFKQFIRNSLRGILVVFRNISLELLILIAASLFAFIPVIGWFIAILSIPVIYIFNWYFLGFNMMDYTCERKEWKISAGATFIRKRKGIAIANGLIFGLILFIPYVGIVIAPVLSSVAATLAMLSALKKKH